MQCSVLLPCRSLQPNKRVGLSRLLKKTSPTITEQSTELLGEQEEGSERWSPQGQTALIRIAQNEIRVFG